MRISDWSSDVCSSDLLAAKPPRLRRQLHRPLVDRFPDHRRKLVEQDRSAPRLVIHAFEILVRRHVRDRAGDAAAELDGGAGRHVRQAATGDGGPVGGTFLGAKSEEHTSELQYLMRI